MKNILIVLCCCLLVITCKKEKSNDYLTEGIWILDHKFAKIERVSVKFQPDNTYIIESRLEISVLDEVHTQTLYGEWTRENNIIDFLSSNVSLNDDSTELYDNTITIDGKILFYVVENNGIYQNFDSINDSSSFYFNDRKYYDGPLEVGTATKAWTIIKLTADSLIVDNEGEIIKYYNE